MTFRGLFPVDLDLAKEFDGFTLSKLTQDVKTDIEELDDKFKIEMDLPGFTKDQVKIKLDNGLLEVSANKEESAETNTEKKYIRKERRASSVSRSFRVGSGVSEDEITAKMEHGVLTIEVPKKEKEADTFIPIQ